MKIINEEEIIDIIDGIGVSMSRSLYESKFHLYLEKTSYIPVAGCLYLKYLDSIGELNVKEMPLQVSNFYQQLSGSVDPSIGTGIQEEKIKSYFDNKYCDDYDIYGDFSNKKALRNIYKTMENSNIIDFSEETKSSIIHIFNELDRNIRNHSGIKDYDEETYSYSVLIYPNKKQIHVALMDTGVGISNTLKNGVIEAVKEGVSAKSNWDYTDSSGRNSGYGLFLCNELSKTRHCLEIIDGGEYFTSFMEENDVGIQRVKVDTFKTGVTLINLIVDIDTIEKDLTNIQENTKFKSGKSKINYLDFDRLDTIFDECNKRQKNKDIFEH